MHLVSDPVAFDEAMRRHFPFFRTACGSAVPNRRLTKDPTRVDCPFCRKLIEEAMGPSHAKDRTQDMGLPDVVEAPATSFDLDDDLYEDLDSMDESSILSEPEDSPGETSSPETPDLMSLLGNLEQVAGLVKMAMPMLSMVTGECPIEPEWSRWVDPDRDEPIPGASLGDIRVLVSSEDLSVLRTLYGFGKDFGLDPLFEVLLSILHRQVLARAALLDDSMDVASEEEDAESEGVPDVEDLDHV